MFTSKRPRTVAHGGLVLILVALLTLSAGPHAHAAQADDAPPTPGEIFQQVSPSIPYIETPTGTADAEMKKGVPYFRHKGVEHDVINANETEYAFIEIELK